MSDIPELPTLGHTAPGQGPFASVASQLGQLGLAVLPCGKESGKAPLVGGFTKWRCPPVESTLEKWSAKNPGANIGVSCGPSRVVVVDIDDAPRVDELIERFGPTPLITRTPSGGVHLWYRNRNFQRSRNLRPSHQLKVDIKAIGGFVVVPPSVRPGTGAQYSFLQGDWSCVLDLPPFRPEALACPAL